MDTNLIYDLISETLGVEKQIIEPGAHFYNDFNAGKLELIDLILKIQQHLKIEINETEYNNIYTVQNLLDIINLHVNEI